MVNKSLKTGEHGQKDTLRGITSDFIIRTFKPFLTNFKHIFSLQYNDPEAESGESR